MEQLLFITEIRQIFQLPPEQRLSSMNTFHHQLCESYCQAVSGITAERAAETSSDGRQIKQVIGHIMQWDRFTLICFGQLLSGVKSRKILWKNGYVNHAGEPYNFGSIDAFNAFQAEHQTLIAWQEIQADAIGIAKTLFSLLSSPAIITPQLLEETETISPELYDGKRIAIPCGWFLWYVILDHQAVEHTQDLYR
jgi:hypothetical protein